MSWMLGSPLFACLALAPTGGGSQVEEPPPPAERASETAAPPDERAAPGSQSAGAGRSDPAGPAPASGEATRRSTPAAGSARELVDPFERVASAALLRLRDPFLVGAEGRGEASGFADPFARARAGRSPEQWSR